MARSKTRLVCCTRPQRGWQTLRHYAEYDVGEPGVLKYVSVLFFGDTPLANSHSGESEWCSYLMNEQIRLSSHWQELENRKGRQMLDGLMD